MLKAFFAASNCTGSAIPPLLRHGYAVFAIRDCKFIVLVRFYQEGKLRQEHTVNDKGNRDRIARGLAADFQLLRLAGRISQQLRYGSIADNSCAPLCNTAKKSSRMRLPLTLVACALTFNAAVTLPEAPRTGTAIERRPISSSSSTIT